MERKQHAYVSVPHRHHHAFTATKEARRGRLDSELVTNETGVILSIVNDGI